MSNEIHIHIHNHHEGRHSIHDQLERIFSHLNTISMDQQQALEKVAALTDQVTKIGTEVTEVKTALADALAAGQQVPAALEAAINNLGSAIQTVDDLNPDAPAAEAQG